VRLTAPDRHNSPEQVVPGRRRRGERSLRSGRVRASRTVTAARTPFTSPGDGSPSRRRPKAEILARRATEVGRWALNGRRGTSARVSRTRGRSTVSTGPRVHCPDATGIPACRRHLDAPSGRCPRVGADPRAAAAYPPVRVVVRVRHPSEAHEHWRPGTDCGICGAPQCPVYRRRGRRPPAPQASGLVR
jgi:hypothetical protein